MAKKNGILNDLLEALGDSGGEIISDLIEGVTGAKISDSQGDALLENLLEGGSGLLDGLGDVMSDLTGVGAVNTKASDVAKQEGKVKSSASAKKKVSSSTTKKKTTATTKTTKTTTSKTTVTRTTTKTKSSATKKKSV